MKYSEFYDKLCSTLAEFEKDKGRNPNDIGEFKEYIAGKFRKPNNKALKSLKGFGF